MIFDTSLQLANNTAVGTTAGTTLIGTQIDTTVAGTLDPQDLFFTVIVTTAIATASAAGTLQLKLASDTTAAVSTTTAQDIVITEAFPTGATTAIIPVGTVLYTGALPKDLGTFTASRRFLGLLAIIGTTTLTAGSVSAYLTTENGRWAALPVAVN